MMKVSELEGVQLDYWVARAEGYAVFSDAPIITDNLTIVHNVYTTSGTKTAVFTAGYNGGAIWVPSVNWSQGGPIIERERIDLLYDEPIWYVPEWEDGEICGEIVGGDTALIAAMRAYVYSKFGDEVADNAK